VVLRAIRSPGTPTSSSAITLNIEIADEDVGVPGIAALSFVAVEYDRPA
jgi:hypothetical protein